MLLKTTNIKIGVRLGLLDQDRTRALIFEADKSHLPGRDQGMPGHLKGIVFGPGVLLQSRVGTRSPCKR
jgi:hypothetical protein